MINATSMFLIGFAGNNREPDENTFSRLRFLEYYTTLANHSAIIAEASEPIKGVMRASAVGKVVDMTTLMGQFYGLGACVVVLEGEIFDMAIGAKVRQIVFGTNDKSLDLLATIKKVVPSASGFAQKEIGRAHV